MDKTLGSTFYLMFTTRAFTTGVPTVLAGSPVLSIYEDNSAVQITAGVALGVSHDSVVGLNLITVVATAGNGFEADKDYNVVITTGTVGGVSVVGEVIGRFSIEAEAVHKRLGAPTSTSISADIAVVGLNVDQIETAVITNAAGADIAADIAEVPTNAELSARTLLAADYFDPAGDAVANVTLVATTTLNSDMRGTDSANLITPPTVTAIRTEMDSNSTRLADIEADTNELQLDWMNTGRLDAILDIIAADVVNLDGAAMRGTDNAALSSALSTAQADLDLITGTDGAQLATVQGLYAPAKAGDNMGSVSGVTGNIDGSLGSLGVTAKADVLTEIVKLLTTQMTESYSADGVAPTMTQALMLIQQALTEFAISGTTLTIKQLDGTTTAVVGTLDDAANPTSQTRTT